MQGRASRRSHLSDSPDALTTTACAATTRTAGSSWDEPSVEPQTSSLVKEQQTRFPSTAVVSHRFSQRIFPSNTGETAESYGGWLVQVRRPQLRQTFGRNCESETPTGLKQPASFVSVTGSASDLLVVRVTRRFGVSRKAWLRSNLLFLWQRSVSFSPEATWRRSGMGEYTEAFRPVKGRHTKFLSRVIGPKTGP